MKLTATVDGKVVTVTGGAGYTTECSTEEVAKRVAYYINTYQKSVKPLGSRPSHVDGWQLDEDREKRVVFRWVDRIITDVGLCNSFAEASKFYEGKNTGPIPQDKEIMKEEPAKDGARSIGKTVEIRWQGKVRTFQCKDEATAQLVAKVCEELEVRPNVESGYRDDSWVSKAKRHEKLEYASTPLLVLRWDDDLVVQNAAVVEGDLERRKIRKQWDAEAKAVAQKAEAQVTEHKPNKDGFLSKHVYRVEPANGKSYWFAVRTHHGMGRGEDMRCANKSVAEALCASDMRHGRAVSALAVGHWDEGGQRYMRVESGVVTECYDSGYSAENKAFAKERLKALGDVKYGPLRDPDPEVTAEEPATDAEEKPIYVKGVEASILEEVNKSRKAYKQTGVLLKPSDALMRGYQAYCGCHICDHIRDYQKQEAAEQNKNIDRATEALIKTAATIQDQKKVQQIGAQDLVINANVTQSTIKSEATNIKESTMANDPKPVRVPSQLELEAQAAALRTAMRQLTKIIHEPLAAALAAQLTPAGGDPAAMKAKVGEFLKSEIGSALVASLLSLGIGSIPANMVPGLTPERQANAAKELRIGAMATAGDTLLDLVMEPLRNVLVGLAAGPAAEALTGVRASDVGLDDAQQETVEATAQQSEGVKKVNF